MMGRPILILRICFAFTASCLGLSGAEAQIGGAEQARLEQQAQTAGLRGDFVEALRFQRQAIENIDRVEPLKQVYRSWMRYKLGALMLVARDCAAAIPVFRESARMVDETEPDDPDPYWKDNIIWASEGVAQAYICLNRASDAAGEVERIESRFGEAPYADCAKAMVEVSGALAFRELHLNPRASSAIQSARAYLAKCDDPDRRVATISIIERVEPTIAQ